MSMQSLNSIHSLTDEQLAHYHTEGYIILRGLFTPEEVRKLVAESDRLVRSDYVHLQNLRTRPRRLTNGNMEVERIDPVVDISEIFHGAVFDDRILGALESIFGEPALLFKDKLIFKVPGMSGYSMHQDFAWWQAQGNSALPEMNPDKILSVMIGIDSATAENGAIQLFPRLHHELLSTPGELRNMSLAEIEHVDLSTGIMATTSPGDVVIFHSLAPHCSELNRSNTSRRQLYMTYNASSQGDVYAAQQEHYRKYTIAGAPGENLYFK